MKVERILYDAHSQKLNWIGMEWNSAFVKWILWRTKRNYIKYYLWIQWHSMSKIDKNQTSFEFFENFRLYLAKLLLASLIGSVRFFSFDNFAVDLPFWKLCSLISEMEKPKLIQIEIEPHFRDFAIRFVQDFRALWKNLIAKFEHPPGGFCTQVYCRFYCCNIFDLSCFCLTFRTDAILYVLKLDDYTMQPMR